MRILKLQFFFILQYIFWAKFCVFISSSSFLLYLYSFISLKFVFVVITHSLVCLLSPQCPYLMQETKWRLNRYLGSRSGKARRLYGTYVRYALYEPARMYGTHCIRRYVCTVRTVYGGTYVRYALYKATLLDCIRLGEVQGPMRVVVRMLKISSQWAIVYITWLSKVSPLHWRCDCAASKQGTPHSQQRTDMLRMLCLWFLPFRRKFLQMIEWQVDE